MFYNHFKIRIPVLLHFPYWTSDRLWSSLYITKYVKTNNCDTLTLIDSTSLVEKDVLWSPRKYVSIENKQVGLIRCVFFLKSNKIWTIACWFLKGVETGDIKIYQLENESSYCLPLFKQSYYLSFLGRRRTATLYGPHINFNQPYILNNRQIMLLLIVSIYP